MAEALNCQHDGTTVWINARDAVAARFGKNLCEVASSTDPGRYVLARPVRGASDWTDFASAVEREFGYAIPSAAVPVRFRAELGVPDEPPPPVWPVPLSRLPDRFDPFRTDVWGRGVVDRASVAAAVASRTTAPDFIDEDFRENETDAAWDAARIAHFVLFPDDTPIAIEVFDASGLFDVADGYHRIAAAIFRGADAILASISGDEAGRLAAFPETAVRPGVVAFPIPS